MSAKAKYEKIDKSKLNDSLKKLLSVMKEKTDNFENEEVVKKTKVEEALDKLIKKYPDAVKKPSKSRTKKSSKAKKSSAKRETVMTVAKRIRKKDESWQDAMKRAKLEMGKSNTKVKKQVDTELEKLKKMIKEDAVLKGFSNSQLQRDAVRKAKPRGKRKSTTKGETTNQYGTFKNKVGRPYWESRENRSDRYAPKYPANKPFLEDGGVIVGGSTVLRNNADIMDLGIANSDAVFKHGGAIHEMRKEKDIDIYDEQMAKGGKIGNDSNTKGAKKYEIFEYLTQSARTPDNEYTINVNDFDKLIEKITKRALDKKIPHIEVEYGGSYLGSINERRNYRFQIGNGFLDNPLQSKMSYINNQVNPKYRMAKGGQLKGFTNDPIYTEGDISVQRVGGSTMWNVAYKGKPKGRVLDAFTKEQAVRKFEKTKDDYFAKGGKTQGYNDKLDESLGMREGREDEMMQSYKDRRNESKGMEKAMGRRAYQSVSTMDEMGMGGYLLAGGTGAYLGAKYPNKVKKVTDPLDKAVEDINRNLKNRYENGGLVVGGSTVVRNNGDIMPLGTANADAVFQTGGVTAQTVVNPNEAMADLQSTYGFDDVYAKGGVLSFKSTKEADKYLQSLSDKEFKKLGDFALVYNGKEYIVKKDFKPVGYAKGGEIIEYSKVYEILESKIEDAVADLYSTYENSEQAEGEEVEYKSRDGFIPFTNGGYSSRWFEYSNMLEGSGISLPTKSLEDKIEEFRENSREYALERFEEEYPEIVKELGGIDNVNYGSLSDAGYDNEADDLDEFERYDDDSIMMEIEAYYYNPNNDRGEDGKHTIQLSGAVNLEAPYHRSGNLEDFIQERFTFNSYKELEDKLDKELAKVVSWFQGDMYDKNPRELKIRRMAKGGVMKTYDDFGKDYDAFTDYVMDRISLEERRKIRKQWEQSKSKMQWQDYLLKEVNKKSMAKGGKIGFEALSKKVAKRYVGKKVPEKFQNEYGKTYSPAEAKEVGDKVAGAVYRMQQAKKMAKGGDIESYDEFIAREDEYLDNAFNRGSDEYKIHNKVQQLMKKDNKWHPDYRGYVDETYYEYYKKAKGFAKGGEVSVYGTNGKYYLKKYGRTYSSPSYKTKKEAENWARLINKGEYKLSNQGLEYVEEKNRLAKGGKTQGYNDKLDESLGNTKGKRSTKEQNYKDRRNESEAMEKKGGRRKYARVKTMDKGSRKLKKPNSFFAVVKRKQKKGEAWKDAIQRVKNEMKK